MIHAWYSAVPQPGIDNVSDLPRAVKQPSAAIAEETKPDGCASTHNHRLLPLLCKERRLVVVFCQGKPCASRVSQGDKLVHYNFIPSRLLRLRFSHQNRRFRLRDAPGQTVHLAKTSSENDAGRVRLATKNRLTPTTLIPIHGVLSLRKCSDQPAG